MQAFSTNYSCLARQLKNEVLVFSRNETNGNKIGKWVALWDTGATSTVINQNVIDVLGLKPVALCKTQTAAGIFETEQYYVDILLPSGQAIQKLLVSRGLSSGWDVLVGMDIIGRGDFAVSNLDGKTSFSFRVPSTEKIDFVKTSKN